MTEQNVTPEQIAAWKRLTGAPDAVRGTGKVEDDAALIAPLLPDSLTGPQPALPEPTQEEVDAFTAAWETERQSIGRGTAPAGQKTRAGLRAAFAVRAERFRVTTDDVISVFDLYGDTYDLETVHDLADLANGVGR